MARVFLCDRCGKVVDDLVVAHIRATGVLGSGVAPSNVYDKRIDLCSNCWSSALAAIRPIEHEHEAGRTRHRWTTDEDSYIALCISEQNNYRAIDLAKIMGVTRSAMAKRIWQIKQLKKNDKAKFDMLLKKVKQGDYTPEYIKPGKD